MNTNVDQSRFKLSKVAESAELRRVVGSGLAIVVFAAGARHALSATEDCYLHAVTVFDVEVCDEGDDHS